MRRHAVVLGLVVSGCGGEDLTCDLLADSGNCWAKAAEAFAACMPARATQATLSADRTTCAFSDGVQVVFDAPLPAATTDLTRLAFSVKSSAGAPCGRFVDTFSNRMELTGGGNTVVSELHGGSKFHLHCDGGPDYESDFSLLFTCQPPARAPTDGFSIENNLFTFTISAVTTPTELFRCGP